MLELASDEIHLWVTYCDDVQNPALLVSCLELLDRGERERVTFFRDDSIRHSYLITRSLVRIVLSRYANVSPESWKFLPDQYGRPYILSPQLHDRPITFNISHAKGLIIIAVSRQPDLGVDVERVGERRSLDESTEAFFSPEELALFNKLPPDERQDLFFQHWTLKESYIKARGLGLSLPLEKIRFSCNQSTGIQLMLDESLGDSPARWRFWQSRLAPDYLVAVCARKYSSPQKLVGRKIIPLIEESELDLGIFQSSISTIT